MCLVLGLLSNHCQKAQSSQSSFLCCFLLSFYVELLWAAVSALQYQAHLFTVCVYYMVDKYEQNASADFLHFYLCFE